MLMIAPVALAGFAAAKEESFEAREDVVKVEVPFEGMGALAACPVSTAPEILANGVATTGTDTSTTDCHYKISVADPTGMRIRAVATFTGDHDVYVKFGTPATSSPYLCSGVSFSSTTESCSANLASAGDYFIRVKRWSGTSDFALTVFIEVPPPTCSLGNGVHPLVGNMSASLTTDTGAFCMFEYTPGSSADFVQFVMTLTSSDFDLYVKKGAQPTTSSYDCRPYSGGTTTERCDALLEDATSFFVMVRRFSGSGGFTIAANEIVIPTLENGVPVQGLATTNTMTYYKVIMPAVNDAGNPTSLLGVAMAGDMSDFGCRQVTSLALGAGCADAEAADAIACPEVDAAVGPGTCAGAGLPARQISRQDADLYVRHKAGLPTTSLYDCRGFNYGSVESCAFSSDAVAARSSAQQNYTAARAEVVAALGGSCVDPTIPETCVPGALPATPGQVQVVPFKGAGKYFVAVRGYSSVASEYTLVAAWA